MRDIDERFERTDQTVADVVRDKMINLTFRREHRTRGREFEQAYNALQGMTKRGDRAADEIVNDADPGAALMEWYDAERTRQEVGSDPDAFAERRVRERMQKDPKFKRAIAQELGFELLDDDGGREPARNGRSGHQTLVRLPSVNSASGRGGGGSNRRNTGEPVTDGDFFADAVSGLATVQMRAGARGR